MTVKELKELLNKLDDDKKVYFDVECPQCEEAILAEFNHLAYFSSGNYTLTLEPKKDWIHDEEV